MKGADSGKIKGGRAKKNVKGTKPKREKKGRKTKKGFVKSEKAYEMLFEQSSDGIIIISGGKIARANQAFCEGYGLPIEKVIGKNPLDMMHHDDRKTAAQRMKSMLAGKVVTESHVYRGLREDGSIVWGDVRSRIIEWEGKPAIQSIIRDITECNRAEDERARMQKEWEDIFQAIGHPTILLDPTHTIIAANKATIKVAKLDKAKIIGKKCWEIFHVSDAYPPSCPMEKILRSEKLETEEMEMEIFKGTYLVSCTPVFDGKGKLKNIIHIATDITEHKKAEEALKQSEEKFRAIAEHSRIGITIVQDLKLAYVNPHVSEITGYSRDELLGMPSASVIHKDSHPEADEKMAELLAGAPFINTELRIDTKSGEERWVDISTILVDFQNKSTFISTVVDITERKRYRVKLAAIYEFSRMMSSTFNINEIVTLVLEASEKILRYGNCAIELVDKEKQELFTVARRGFPEDIPFLRLPLNSEKGLVIACIHEGKTIYVSDTRKDERYYEEIESTLSNLCVPLKVGGEVIGVFDIESPHLNGFIEEDISLAQMLASSAAIAIENARLYEQTKQSKFQLEFVTDLMSHDLSNINQIALGSIGILSESELSEYQKKLVTSAKNAVRRSTGLVSNFKTLQRISKQAEEKKKTELSSIIGDAIKKMSDYPGKIVKIEYAPREGQLVYADDNLSRALENLFDNAIKFTLQEKMRIDVEVFEEGDTFNVRVKDWGTGVSDLMKEEIFKRFEKLGEGRLGTGLGLYVSKKIVEDHGGKIWVHDNPEGGSVFVVQIPRFPTMLK